MAVPKRKTTPSKRNMRRSHHALTATNVVEDSTSGTYRGKQVLDAQD
jgi:large subunit ribosomal protein L32